MIMNLVLSRIINKLPYIDKIFNPLIINTIDNSFKLFLNDVGFFSETVSLKRIQIDNNDNVWTNVKGGLTENFVYNELFKIREIYCYKYVKKSHQKEIDFVLQGNNFNQVIIECKSSFNKRAVSFDNFIKTADKIIAIKNSKPNSSTLFNIKDYVVQKMDRIYIIGDIKKIDTFKTNILSSKGK